MAVDAFVGVTMLMFAATVAAALGIRLIARHFELRRPMTAAQRARIRANWEQQLNERLASSALPSTGGSVDGSAVAATVGLYDASAAPARDQEAVLASQHVAATTAIEDPPASEASSSAIGAARPSGSKELPRDDPAPSKATVRAGLPAADRRPRATDQRDRHA